MAAVASPINTVPLSTVSESGPNSLSANKSKSTPRRLSSDQSTGTQTFLTPLHTPEHGSKNYRTSANWHNYNMNGKVNVSFTSTNPIPSPPATDSTLSLRSSTSSSPSELANEASSPPAVSYFKPRSRSMAIPATTSCCPNCGLRRPSITSDQTDPSFQLPPSPTAKFLPQLPLNHRPHLPVHLHCPNACPDDVFPTSPATTQIAGSPYHQRHHHRRRSSLCYAESLVGHADDLVSGAVPTDVKLSWERQAESIARKVVQRESSTDSVDNDRIEEEDVAVVSD